MVNVVFSGQHCPHGPARVASASASSPRAASSAAIMAEQFRNWRWHYVQDDPSLTWGAPADRALLRRSPAYALAPGADSSCAARLGASWHDDLWSAVLGFCPLPARLRLAETSRGMRGFCSVLGGDESRLEALAVHAQYPVSPVAAAVVGVELARVAVAQLAAPPDVVVVVAARPWADEVPAFRRSIRGALPATACSLSTVVDAFRDPRDGAVVADGVALLAIRLPRPLAPDSFGPVAVSRCLRAARPLLRLDVNGPSPDALDLVALLDGDDDCDDAAAAASAAPRGLRWLLRGLLS